LKAKINEPSAEKLRVFVDPEGINPHYQQHLEDTFRHAGVQFVATREEANLVIDGSGSPSYGTGQVAAFVQSGQLAFAGEL
jgi:hypothetical protein